MVKNELLSRALFACALLGMVAIAVIFPRLAAIGDFIHMDEGYHDYMAKFVHHSIANGEGFPPQLIGYKLYNILFFWVYYLPGNGTIWLRAVDLVVAAVCGAVFCLMLCRESGSKLAGLLLCLGFFTGMNLPGAIDSGFKNSFFPSFLCMFLAIYITTRSGGSIKRWYWAGALTAIAILFRETFLLFPVIAAVALLLNRNFGELWRFVVGGIGMACLITAILMVVRGQVWGIFEFYFIYGKIYGPEAGRRLFKFWQNGTRALGYFSPLVCLTILSLVVAIRRRELGWHNRAAFWLACSLSPLLEPLSKIGFLYHFSACLPAMAGLCAHTFASCREGRNIWLSCMAMAAILMLPFMYPHYEKIPTTRETLAAWPNSGWPDSLVPKSTTLQAAKKIAGLGDGTLAASGFAYFLFPASGRQPVAMDVADLSRTWIYSGQDAEKFRQRLDSARPDVVAIGSTHDDHSAIFERELTEIFSTHPDYEYAGYVPPDQALNYGWLGYNFYKRKKRDTEKDKL